MTGTLFNDKVLHLCVLGTRDARFTLLLAALMTFPSTNLVRDPMGSPLSVNPASPRIADCSLSVYSNVTRPMPLSMAPAPGLP